MKNNLKVLSVASVLFTVILLKLASPVYAHSGKTDEDGGHYDSSTGGYHYHHGYPAHDHYDMDGDGDLDCPYNFVDNTDYCDNSDGLEPQDESPEIASGIASAAGTVAMLGIIKKYHFRSKRA